MRFRTLSLLLIASCDEFVAENRIDPDATAPDASAAPDAAFETSAPGDSSADTYRPPVDCDASYCRLDTERYFFVTSNVFRGDFAAGADAGARALGASICADEANARARYPDLAGRRWTAWLGTSQGPGETSAGLTPDIEWIRPDGTLIVAASGPLGSNPLEAPVMPTAAGVWTGRSNGCQSSCFDFTAAALSDGGALFGCTGRADSIGSWRYYGTLSCGESYPIYCLEATP